MKISQLSFYDNFLEVQSSYLFIEVLFGMDLSRIGMGIMVKVGMPIIIEGIIRKVLHIRLLVI